MNFTVLLHDLYPSYLYSIYDYIMAVTILLFRLNSRSTILLSINLVMVCLISAIMSMLAMAGALNLEVLVARVVGGA